LSAAAFAQTLVCYVHYQQSLHLLLLLQMRHCCQLLLLLM
jgi:hypothetical protein